MLLEESKLKLDVFSSFKLAGRVALVTGASRGFGEVIASALAEAGAAVALVARSDSVYRIANELTDEHGVSCKGYQCDVSSEDAVTKLIAEIIKDFRGLHIVVNNAGINTRGSIEDLELDQFQEVQDTNITSMWLICRAVARHFKEQQYGRVLNIGSLLSVLGMPGRTPYAVSKGGVLQLTRVLAVEWASYGITVNCLIPGVFGTEMNRVLLDDPKKFQTMTASIPLGRWGEPEEIAGISLFLASDASSYVTGAAMTIDGGWSVH